MICFYQGGLNNKEIQVSPCNIFSILIFNKLCLLAEWLNRIILGRAVTFMKYLVSVVSLIFLIFLLKTLIRNKATLPASNSLNLAELVVDELMRNISQKIYQYCIFYLIYHCLIYKFQELITKELNKFKKSSSVYTFINQEPPAFELCALWEL